MVSSLFSRVFGRECSLQLVIGERAICNCKFTYQRRLDTSTVYRLQSVQLRFYDIGEYGVRRLFDFELNSTILVKNGYFSTNPML